jgi:hypothetical protein
MPSSPATTRGFFPTQCQRDIGLTVSERINPAERNKIGRPIEGGLNTVAACKSADQRDPFLGCRFGCGGRLCRKLEHCCFLIFKQVG